MNLLALQQHMRTWLMGDEAITGMDLSPGYHVYRNNYRVQLVRCLEASYPALHDRLGAEEFRQASIQHVQEHPPHNWTLDAYGAHFPSTLRDRYPCNPDLHELAWIEWSLAESFVASDASATPASMLAGLDWDAVRLCFDPSVRVSKSATNAVELWQAWQAGDPRLEGEMASPGGILVWREGFTCRVQRVDAIEHAALMLLQEESRFEQLCTALVEHLGTDAGVRRAGELLAGWLQIGIVHCEIE